jgi:hypothetical protein
MQSMSADDLDSFEMRFSERGWTLSPGGRMVDETETVLWFQQQVSSDVSCMSSFDFVESDHGVATYPSIGVLHYGISVLNGQFLGLPSGDVWTFSLNLSDVLKKQGIEASPYRRWLISSPASIPHVANVLQSDITAFAMPVISSHLTLDGIISYLEDEGARRYQAQAGQLAIAYALRTEMPSSIRLLEEYAAEAGRQRSPMSVQSWNFVKAFVRHFGIEQEMLPFSIPSGP